MKRNATAVWNGTIKDGNGILNTQSGTLKDSQFSFKTKLESGIGTNPEELIAAAHSSCFTMTLSNFLTEENFNPEKLVTKCEVTFGDGKLTKSHLILEAKVANLDQDKFDALVKKAKENCLVSKLLKTDISVETSLNK